jgi:ATP-dependent exoDNAse (exonuclease V) alpha subunit
MVKRLNRGLGRFERLGQRDFIVSDRLRPEQKNVIHLLLDSRDLAVNLRGAAGTGKTATLQEFHRDLREADRRVIAVAPTMSAVEELQKVGFASAMSLEKLLQDQKAHRELRGSLVVVDEAGMVSGNQMSQLLRLAEQQSARIVGTGLPQTRQIGAIREVAWRDKAQAVQQAYTEALAQSERAGT